MKNRFKIPLNANEILHSKRMFWWLVVISILIVNSNLFSQGTCNIPQIETVWSGTAGDRSILGEDVEFSSHESVYAQIMNAEDGIMEHANEYGAIYDADNVLIVTQQLDNTWGDHLNFDSSFNTVFDCDPGSGSDGVFEVVSATDESGTLRASSNPNEYYFSYDGLNDWNAGAITIEEWVDYLEQIKNTYGRIGRLTIFCHGNSNLLWFSDAFTLHYNNTNLVGGDDVSSNQHTRDQLFRLQDILTDNAHILLFSCKIAASESGHKLVQELAYLTGATVHANSNFTGDYSAGGDSDWSLDVVKYTDYYGDSCEEAFDIGLGTRLSGVIATPGDIDYFKFELPQPGYVTIYSQGETDTYGYIYDENCTILYQDDNSASDGHNFRLKEHLDAGTHYLAVKHAGSDGTGHYDISLSYETDRLTTTNWAQSGEDDRYCVYYDALTEPLCSADPIEGGSRYLVGCTAVAVGQLLNYYLPTKRSIWLETMLHNVTVYPRFVDSNDDVYISSCTHDGYTTNEVYANSIEYVNSPEGNEIRKFLWNVAIGLDARFELGGGTGVSAYRGEPYDWVDDSNDKIQSLLIDRFRINTLMSHVDDLSRLDAEKDYIISSINNNNPVLLSMYGDYVDPEKTGRAGHTTIIDAYKLYADGTMFVKINFGWGNSENTNEAWYDGRGAFDDAIHYINWDSFCIYKNTVPVVEPHGTLMVTTTPVEGEIFVNGELKGIGEWSGQLVSGTHTISFGQVEGYSTPQSQQVQINQNQTTEVIGNYNGVMIANFSASPHAGELPLPTQFTDLSQPQDGSIISWQWDFDNNGVIDSEEQNPSFTFQSAGSYTVSLTIGDGDTTVTHTKINYIIVNAPEQSQNVVAVEYFWDTDPGVGSGIAVDFSAAPSGSVSKNISVSGLSTGVHRLYVRAQDESGNWGLVQSAPVLVQASTHLDPKPNIANVEYYLDVDPGEGNAEPITVSAQDSVNVNTNIAMSGTETGVHRIYFRAQDQWGNWGIEQSAPILVSEIGPNDPIPEITHVEYFIDQDPGLGQAESVAFTDGTHPYFNLNIPIDAALSSSDHALSIRALDEYGHWSVTSSRIFSVIDQWSGLANGTVSPTQGSTYAAFTYAVDYVSADGAAHPVGVKIDNHVFAMQLETGSATDGRFSFTQNGLDSGIHGFQFFFVSATGDTNWYPEDQAFLGPNVNSSSPVLMVTPSVCELAASAGQHYITVECLGGSGEWNAQISQGQEWLSIVENSTASGNDSITISVTANFTGAVRSGTVQISADWAGNSPLAIPVNQQTGSSLQKSLNSGWNWFSLNMNCEDMTVSALLAELGDKAAFIKNQTSFSQYYDGFGWYSANGLDELDSREMYMLKMNQAAEVSFSGEPIASASAIALNPGWNWVGFLPQSSIPLATALASLEANGEFIKNQTSFSQYYDGYGWYSANGLDVMVPGEGYMLKMKSSGELIFPASGSSLAKISTPMAKEAACDIDPYAFEHSMAITGKLQFSGSAMDVQDMVVFAYVDGECRGCSRLQTFPLSQEQQFNMLAYGTPGEEIQLYAGNDTQNWQARESFIFKPDAILGNGLKPVTLSMSSSTRVLGEAVPETFQLYSNYPNPFNPETTIRYAVPSTCHILISVYDITGKFVCELVNATQQPGTFQVVWNGTTSTGQQVSSGVYFYRMQTETFNKTKKMLLTR